MARERKKESVNTDAWLNTYADMVTLVLCFFVLLYSMSSIDSQKWEFLVKSFNPSAEFNSPMDINDQEDADEQLALLEPEDPGDITFEEIAELYLMLKAYVEENDLEDSVELMKGEGLVFLTFRNNIFFEGDSWDLKDEGKVILDVLAGGLEGIDEYVGEVRILGHTTQRRPDRINSIYEDRYIASNRAVEVLLYLQGKDVIEAKKYISVGYGQHYPISPFDTEENRARNRRVEIIIMQDDDRVNHALESVYDELGIGLDEADAQSGLAGVGADVAAAGAEGPGTAGQQED